MSVLNHTCTYAIRAALYVAGDPAHPEGFVSTRRIADDLGVSFPFLTKVLQGLTQAGIFVSQRGASGGVSLSRASSDITLHDVLVAAGGDDILHDCLLGLPTCSDLTPCAVHEAWRVQRARLEALFRETTLAALAGQDGQSPPADLLAALSPKPPQSASSSGSDVRSKTTAKTKQTRGAR